MTCNINVLIDSEIQFYEEMKTKSMKWIELVLVWVQVILMMMMMMMVRGILR
jgi:hypothetical protein